MNADYNQAIDDVLALIAFISRPDRPKDITTHNLYNMDVGTGSALNRLAELVKGLKKPNDLHITQV